MTSNRELWDLAKDSKVPEYLRQACCPKDKLSEMADALDKTNNDIVSTGDWSHFGDIANSLREINLGKKDYRLRGVALSCTSVSDTWIYWSPDKDGDAWDCYRYATIIGK